MGRPSPLGPKKPTGATAFTEGDILNIIRCREAVINDGMHLFSHKIEVRGEACYEST